MHIKEIILIDYAFLLGALLHCIRSNADVTFANEGVQILTLVSTRQRPYI